MASKIQLRRDTAANWTSTNPVLAQGEPGVELDSKKLKIGDGTSTWTALPYASGGGDAGSLVYKGATDITAAPPAGPKAGWTYIASPGGTANAGWTGLTGNIPAGTTIFYSGAAWALLGSAPVPDLWSRTGTEITPKTAGDSVFTSGAVKVGGTTAAPNITVKADGGIVANTNGLVYDAATKRLAIGSNNPQSLLHLETDGTALRIIRGSSTGFLYNTGIASNSATRLHADKGPAELYVNDATQPIVFNSISGERGRWDSSGRFLVGTSSTSANGAQLQVVSGVEGIDVLRYGNNAAGTNIVLYKTRGATNVHGVVSANDSLGQVTFSGSDGANYIAGASIRTEVDGTPGTNDMPGRLVFSTCPDSSAIPVERMRIGSNGHIRVNGTLRWDKTNIGTSGGWISYDAGADRLAVANDSGGSGAGVALAPGATSWSTYSDERLKDIIEPIDDGLTKVGSLRAVIGKYKTDSDGTRRAFLIAQDVQAVLPEAVSADATDDACLDLRYTEVIPLLVAALKESKERIEVLEQRLTNAGIA